MQTSELQDICSARPAPTPPVVNPKPQNHKATSPGSRVASLCKSRRQEIGSWSFGVSLGLLVLQLPGRQCKSGYLDCKRGFSDLAAGYAANMATMRRSHRRLRTTWRQGGPYQRSAMCRSLSHTASEIRCRPLVGLQPRHSLRI